MITISETLNAAQKRLDARPYVELKAWEKLAGVGRLRWARWYTGSEADAYHAVAVTGNGSLLRTYRDPGGSIVLNRTINPGLGSDFASTTSLITAMNNSAIAGHALCASDADAYVFCFDQPNTHLRYRSSSDHGATWSAIANICTIASGTQGFIAAARSSDKLMVFYSVDNVIYSVYYNYPTSTWVGPNAWANTVASVTGIACHYTGDFNLIMTGTDASGNANVWNVIYGDGYALGAGVWSSLNSVIVQAANGSGIAYSSPTLLAGDVYRLIFREEYTGMGAYTRTLASHSISSIDFGANLWREPYPVDINCLYGVALGGSPSSYYITIPSGVWQADTYPPSLDLTTDLLELHAEVLPEEERLIARVRNDLGKYLDSTSGKGQAWLGTQLDLGVGYHTSAGDEATRHLSFWVDDYELTVEKGKADLILHASGPWSFLERWKARRQFTWTAGSHNIQMILTFLLARTGFHLAPIGNSDLSVTLFPAFTIHPDESAASAVRRLLEMVPDTLHFQYANAVLTERNTGDAAVYSFGTGHAILGGSYRQRLADANRVQVYAADAFGEDFTWPEVELVYDHLKQVHDLNVSGAANAASAATAHLRRAFRESRDDKISVFPSCGLELYDVIEITESRAGLNAARRRVIGITLHYDAQRATYRQEIRAGEV